MANWPCPPLFFSDVFASLKHLYPSGSFPFPWVPQPAKSNSSQWTGACELLGPERSEYRKLYGRVVCDLWISVDEQSILPAALFPPASTCPCAGTLCWNLAFQRTYLTVLTEEAGANLALEHLQDALLSNVASSGRGKWWEEPRAGSQKPGFLLLTVLESLHPFGT